MTPDEEIYWIEAGLQCDGVELDDWTKDAIIRYGRMLTDRFMNDIHDMRLEISAQAAIIEQLKKQIQR
jgi:hypothetical protein